MTVTATPSIDELPPTPQRLTDDADTYVAKMDAWLIAWPAYRVQTIAVASACELNAIAAEAAASSAEVASAAAGVAIAATHYIAESATSLTLDAGIKALTIMPIDGNWAAEREVVLIARANIAARMFGYTASNDGAGHLVVNIPAVVGAVQGDGGPYDDWLIMAGEFFTPGASGPDIWAGESAMAAATPLAMMQAAGFTALTDAATIAWNAKTQGFNVYVVLGGNRTMGAPTNLKDGVTYSFYPKQDATGARTLSWNAIFDWGINGAPGLSTGANKADQCWGQYSALTGKIHMSFRKSA